MSRIYKHNKYKFNYLPLSALVVSCRFVEVFISETSDDLKTSIITNFIHNNTATCVVACTEVFALGLDCKDIRQAIHYRASKTVEGYVQETGRAGRDQEQARAILFPVSSKLTGKAITPFTLER